MTDSIYREGRADFLKLEEFLRRFLYEMTLEATDGNVKISLDYVSEEKLTEWAGVLADMIN